MFEKLNEMKVRHELLSARMQEELSAPNSQEKTDLIKEYMFLDQTLKLHSEYQDLQKDIQSYENILSEGKEDKDFIQLAKEEVATLKQKEQSLLIDLKNLLIPKDPLDEKNIIMEIRPAAGGDESGIFCGDLFTMYSRYADKKNWKVEVLSSSPGTHGGFKELICSVSGSQVYAHFKYESGVHRVQRVPKTETQGRVHTSTVTVVVLPSVSAKAVVIRPQDVRVDTFRSSGAGGQHVNTTDSAIRMVHLPTKITVQCQDEKSQHANKEKAMKILRARIYDLEQRKKKEKESQTRLAQIGTGDRSEKIRTYNFPQSRITDHRAGVTVYNLDQIITGGDLDSLIEEIKIKLNAEKVK